MKTIRQFALFAVVFGLSWTAVLVYAQELEENPNACLSECKKFCPGLIMGGGLGNCLLDHMAQLSSECTALVRRAQKVIEEDRRVCDVDARAICGLVVKGEFSKECLKKHKSRLSEDCKSRLNRADDLFKAALIICKPDVDKFCENQTNETSATIKCLAQNAKHLSDKCRVSLPWNE